MKESKHTKCRATKSHAFTTKTIVAAVLMATQTGWAASPFAPLPLHMSGATKSSAKPNVALVLDNSGSMHGIVEKDGIYPSRAYAEQYCKDYYRGLEQWQGSRSRTAGDGKLTIRYMPNTGYEYGTAVCSDGRYQLTMYYCPSEATMNTMVSRYGWDRVYSLIAGGQMPAAFRTAGWNTNTCTLPENQRLSRIQTLKQAVNGLLKDPENANVRWGVRYLNYLDFTNAKDVLVGDNTAGRVLQSINDVVAFGGTPMTNNYLRSVSENYIFGDAIEYRCQKNFVVGLTDGESNGSSIWTSTHISTITNSSRSRVEQWFKDNWSLSTSPRDLNTYTYTNGAINDENGLSALSSILYNKDLKIGGVDKEGNSWDDAPFNMQNVSTYTINFGNTTSAGSTNYLTNGATHGGGVYYSAANATQLGEAFKNILNAVNTSSKNAAVTPSANSSAGSTELGALSLTLDLTAANSKFQFSKLPRASITNEITTGVVDNTKSIEFGTLTNNSDNASSRRVLFSAAGIAPKFLQSTDINWAGYTAGSVQQSNAYEWLIRSSSKSDAVIGSLRVRDSKDVADRMMGDVVNGSVLQVGDIKDNYSKYLISAANDGMLHILQRQDGNSAKPFALKLNWIVGAASRESGSTDATVWDAIHNTLQPDYAKSGNNPHLYLLDGGIGYRSTYNGHHFAIGTHGRGGKGAYGFNIGGNRHDSTSTAVGIDAVQNDWNNSVPLFETANNAFAANNSDANTWAENQKMGYTIGAASILRAATERSAAGLPVLSNINAPVRYIATVGNGYGSSEALPALYIYDALGQAMSYNVDSAGKATAPQQVAHNSHDVGKLIAKIPVPNDTSATNPLVGVADNGATLNNGLSAPVLVDVDSDGLADVAYAGDLNGNMYRFDLRGTTPAQWKAHRILKGSQSNPITAAPAVYRVDKGKVVVMFGTGRDLFTGDLTDKTDQYFYGVYDDLSKGWSTAGGTCATPSACQTEIDITKDSDANGVIDDLVKQTLTQFSVGTNSYRTLSNNSLDDNRGWYIPLSTNTGERVTVQPTVVDNTVFFTTRIYQQQGTSSQVCSVTNSDGYSWLMGASVLSGAGMSSDTSNIGTVNNGSNVVYIAGQRLTSLASGTSFLSSILVGVANAVNENGQAQDGQDSDLHTSKPNGEQDDHDYCRDRSSGTLNYATANDGVQSRIIYNRSCAVTIKRLSWREIF